MIYLGLFLFGIAACFMAFQIIKHIEVRNDLVKLRDDILRTTGKDPGDLEMKARTKMWQVEFDEQVKKAKSKGLIK